MHCRNTDELIRAGRLEGLSPAEQRELEAHLAACSRCRELVRPDLFVEALQPPADLLASVLQETGGPACDRAESLLSARLDGDLERIDAQLVDAHADDCTGCDALRTALAQLAEDLPAMRELEPDAAFTSAVFERTSRSVSPIQPQPSDRIRRLWKQLVQRPRFAWEAAYVGAMVFWLVLSLPLVTLPEAPAGAQSFLPDFSGVRATMQTLRDPVSDFTRKVQSSTRAGWSSASERVQQDLQKRTVDLQTAIDSIEVERSGDALVTLTLDARDAVQRLVQKDATTNQDDRSEP